MLSKGRTPWNRPQVNATTAPAHRLSDPLLSDAFKAPNVDWEALQPAIAPTVKRGGASGLVDTGVLDYERFLVSPLVVEAGASDAASRAAAEPAGELSTLYRSLDSLHAVIEMLDTDKNGVVDRAEFRHGLRLLNEELPEGEKLDGDADELFDAMDTDGSEEISIAELTEAFRVSVVRGRPG